MLLQILYYQPSVLFHYRRARDHAVKCRLPLIRAKFALFVCCVANAAVFSVGRSGFCEHRLCASGEFTAIKPDLNLHRVPFSVLAFD